MDDAPRERIQLTREIRALLWNALPAGETPHYVVKRVAGAVSRGTVYKIFNDDRDTEVHWSNIEAICEALRIQPQEVRDVGEYGALDIRQVHERLAATIEELRARIADEVKQVLGRRLDLGVLLQRLDPRTQYLEVVNDRHRFTGRKPSAVGEVGLAVWKASPLYVARLLSSLSSHDAAVDRKLSRKWVYYLPLDASGARLQPEATTADVFLILTLFSKEEDPFARVIANRFRGDIHAFEDRLADDLCACCGSLMGEAARLARREIELEPSTRVLIDDVEVKLFDKTRDIEQVKERLKSAVPALGVGMVAIREVFSARDEDKWKLSLKLLDCDAVIDRVFRAQQDACFDRTRASGGDNRYFQSLAAVLENDTVDREARAFHVDQPTTLPQEGDVRFQELYVPIRAACRSLAGYVLVLGGPPPLPLAPSAKPLQGILGDCIARVIERACGALHVAEDDARAVFESLLHGSSWLETAVGDPALAKAALKTFGKLKEELQPAYIAVYRIGAEMRLTAPPSSWKMDEAPRAAFVRARVIDRFRRLVRYFDPGEPETRWLVWDRGTCVAALHAGPSQRALLRLPRVLEREDLAICIQYGHRYVQVAIFPRHAVKVGVSTPTPYDPSSPAPALVAGRALGWAGVLTFERDPRTARCEAIVAGEKKSLAPALFGLGSFHDKTRIVSRHPKLAEQLRQFCPDTTIDLREVIQNGGLYTEEYCQAYNEAALAEVVAGTRKLDASTDGYQWLRDKVVLELPEVRTAKKSLPLLRLATSFLRPVVFREQGKDPTLLVSGDRYAGASIRLGGLKRYAQRASVHVRKRGGRTFVIEAYLTRSPFDLPTSLDEFRELFDNSVKEGGLGWGPRHARAP